MPPHPASTVVLLRANPRLEVFLVRRHDDVAFMGGAHVFPGGRIEQADYLVQPERICDGLDTAAAAIPDLSPASAVACHVGALRELFEEAGILLARRNGEMVSLHGDDDERMRRWRRELSAGQSAMWEVAERENVRLALDSLAYFAHWVTPEIETRRFDTRFFLAAAPDHQHAAHDAGETTHGEWVAPAAAIARCRDGDIALPPPTWTTLRQLERFATVEDAMQWARACGAVPRVEPGFIQQGETRIVLLPGDPGCPDVAGFSAEETRFLLEGGRWRPVPISDARS
jgi:8-oxo-dGTP pyrophosphatase MutT (NUDIX family)